MTHHSIVVFCAHSDDHIFGAGGTLSKYAKEGKEVYTYVFSYGELSHPWLKSHVSVNMRKTEAEDANATMNGKSIEFFGLKEGNFLSESKDKKIYKKIEKIILEKKPIKVFTHAIDDPHPDHRAVHDIVLSVLDKTNHNCDLYTFDVWNWVNFKDRNIPRMVVNIDGNFSTKIKALYKFKSQWIALIVLLPSVYLRAILHGLKRKMKFAEVFRKVR